MRFDALLPLAPRARPVVPSHRARVPRRRVRSRARAAVVARRVVVARPVGAAAGARARGDDSSRAVASPLLDALETARELDDVADPFYRVYACADGRSVYVVAPAHAGHQARCLEAVLGEAKLPVADPYAANGARHGLGGTRSTASPEARRARIECTSAKLV